jgi:hypothetical protein
MIKAILLILLLIAVILLAIALVATVLVVFATGLGSLFMRFLPFTSVEAATVIALLALIAASAVIWQVLAAIVSSPRFSNLTDGEEDAEKGNEEFEEEDEEEWIDDDEEEDDGEPYEAIRDFVPSIPRWRQPIKPVSFEGVGRNDLCPCGSGRKYKNCHGRATAQSG